MPASSIDDIRNVLAERLKVRRAALGARLASVTADRRRTREPLDPDFAEQVPARENDEVLDALDEVERQELVDVDAALRRIDAGFFGICDACGEDIDPLRLDAIPTAALCLQCAEKREATSRA